MISGADDIGWGPEKKTGKSPGHSVLGDLFKNLVKKRDEDPDDGATEPDDPTGISYTAPGRFYPVSGGAANQVPGYRPIDNFSFPGYGMPGAVNHPRAVNPMPVISSGLSPQPLWPGTRQGNLFGFKKGVTPIGSVERLKQQWLLPGSGSNESNELEGSFIPSVLSSISPVTNTYPTTGNNEQVEGEVVKTHFICKGNGRYLGESKAYYDWARVNLPGEKVVTFPELKINIKSIPFEDWDKIDSQRSFEHISPPIEFDKKDVIKGFTDMVEKNKIISKEQRNVEQLLVIIYDSNSNKIRQILFPDFANTGTEAEFSSIVKTVQIDKKLANFLIPSQDEYNYALDKEAERKKKDGLFDMREEELYNERRKLVVSRELAIKNPNDDNYYTAARDTKLLVIGFSHTHPEVREVSRTTILIRSSITIGHSDEDLKISRNKRLPDIIAKVSVDFDITFNSSKTIVTLELLPPNAAHKDAVQPLPKFDTFLKKIEENIFDKIIKQYD